MWIALCLALLFVACSSNASLDKQGFCSDIGSMREVLLGVSQQTMTSSEAIAKLDKVQNNLSVDADAFAQDNDSQAATAARDLANSAGHLKTALAGESDLATAQNELDAAIGEIPAGICQ